MEKYTIIFKFEIFHFLVTGFQYKNFQEDVSLFFQDE